MPAKILVLIDGRPERELWVEEEVLRIGSASGSDIQVRHGQVSPHSATLEFVEGRYVVYNRNDYPLPLGRGNVPPRGASPWGAGELLALDDEVVFQLQIDGDPAPAPRPRARVEEPPAPDYERAALDDDMPGPASDPRPARARAAVQIAVILAALGAVGWLLQYDPEGAANPEAGGPSFGALMRAMGPERLRDDPDLAAIRAALQEARIARRRGDSDRARAAYLAIRDLLERRGDLGPARPDDDPAPALESLIWKYVRARL